MRTEIEGYIETTLSNDPRLGEGLMDGVEVEAGLPYEKPTARLQVWLHEGPSEDLQQDYIEGGTDVSMSGITTWSVTCRIVQIGSVQTLYQDLRTLTQNVFRVLRDMVEGPTDSDDDAHAYWGYAKVTGFGQPYALRRQSKDGGRTFAGVQQEIAFSVEWNGTWTVGD